MVVFPWPKIPWPHPLRPRQSEFLWLSGNCFPIGAMDVECVFHRHKFDSVLLRKQSLALKGRAARALPPLRSGSLLGEHTCESPITASGSKCVTRLCNPVAKNGPISADWGGAESKAITAQAANFPDLTDNPGGKFSCAKAPWRKAAHPTGGRCNRIPPFPRCPNAEIAGRIRAKNDQAHLPQDALIPVVHPTPKPPKLE